MTRTARDKTGDFYKVRSWDPRSVTWMQTKNTYNDKSEAIDAAKKMETSDLRVQTIHLVGNSVRKMKLTVVYDSKPGS